MRKSRHYIKRKNKKVKCQLCPHQCILSEGMTGLCRSRKNIDGELFVLNYGKCAAIAFDKVKKKPLYHFHPDEEVLSIGTIGCNFNCKFCQNWELSQTEYETVDVTPERIVELAQQKGIGIAYTYTEPLMWYEFVYDTAKLAKEKGLKNILITNGFIEVEPLKSLLEYIDAANVDLKAFSNEFYMKLCGRVGPIKRAIRLFNEKCHLELTTVIIPGENDSLEEMEEMVNWIAGLNPNIPLHIGRYYPSYRLDKPPTPIETLERLRKIANKKLSYVYINNVKGE